MVDGERFALNPNLTYTLNYIGFIPFNQLFYALTALTLMWPKTVVSQQVSLLSWASHGQGPYNYHIKTYCLPPSFNGLDELCSLVPWLAQSPFCTSRALVCLRSAFWKAISASSIMRRITGSVLRAIQILSDLGALKLDFLSLAMIGYLSWRMSLQSNRPRQFL